MTRQGEEDGEEELTVEMCERFIERVRIREREGVTCFMDGTWSWMAVIYDCKWVSLLEEMTSTMRG